jgi:glycosyltransferase involved in cell wall biosynthesis
MITYLYRLSLRRFPSLHKAAVLLPQPIQNLLKRGIRKRMAAANMAQANGGGLVARDGGIAPAGLNRALAPGVTVAGYIKGDLSLGILARATLQSLEATGVPCGAVNFTLGLQHSQSNAAYDRLIAHDPGFIANIFCMSAATLTLCHQERADLFAGRYNIHYAVWELAKYPAPWMPAMNLVHELWTISTFMQQAVAACATVPVLSMGIPVECTLETPLPRSAFGLPERRFLFLFSYDIGSLTERKNPQAVLRAFLQAFPPGNNDVAVVIKMNFIPGRADHAREIAELKQAWAHDSRILFMDRILDHSQMLSLIHACDAYVSLHRAEGFGLGMAEAMQLRKPVIATAYSGNMDFTRAHNSCLVDYRLIPVQPNQFSFAEGQVWADADASHASYYMKKLVSDRAFYDQLAAAGQRTIAEEFSLAAIGGKIKDRLKLLGLAG